MLRKMLNASRLQEEMKRRIQRLQEVVDDGVKIVVPRPQRQAPDASGCNWTMKHFGNAAGFEHSVAGVLETMRAQYNLPPTDDADEPPADNASLSPFGDAPREAAKDPFGGADSAASPTSGKPRDPFASD